MRRQSILASMILPLAACGGAEVDPVVTGLSSLMADPVAGEVQSFADLVVAARGEAPGGLTLSNGRWIGLRDQLELSFEIRCGAAPCDPNGSAEIDVEWKGRVEDTRYELDLERSARWKTTSIDADTARVEGDVTLKMKSDFKDYAEDFRHKYDFDAKVRYDVVVTKLSGEVLSGSADFDLDAKEKMADDDTKVKSQLKLRVDATFTDGVADLEIDKLKYRLKLRSGDLELM